MLNLLEKLNSIVIGFSERDNLQHIPYLASHVSDMDLYINVDARFNGFFFACEGPHCDAQYWVETYLSDMSRYYEYHGHDDQVIA